METVYFQGNACHTAGMLPSVGDKAPDFTLVDADLKELHPSDFPGKKIVLNIFPSLDTAVCAMSVRKFNEKAASKKMLSYYACQWTFLLRQSVFALSKTLRMYIPPPPSVPLNLPKIMVSSW